MSRNYGMSNRDRDYERWLEERANADAPVSWADTRDIVLVCALLAAFVSASSLLAFFAIHVVMR